MTKRNFLVLLAVLVIACALPFLVSNYRTFQLTLVLIIGVLTVKPSGFFGKVHVTRV